MSEGLISVSAEDVPRGRGTNPFNKPVIDVAAELAAEPGEWFIIGTGETADRSRLNNAAALLSGSKYKSLLDYYERGKFETRVSGAKDAPHADLFPVAVYARFVPNGRTGE